MGGVQSSAHNLGEALWVQERQRQRCHRVDSGFLDNLVIHVAESHTRGGHCLASMLTNRESNRQESPSEQDSQDRRKLLKRTRSLAVISEDECRQERENRHFRLGESSTLELPKRYQLIPRAKLIDRNSLKDRLCKSQQHLSDSYEQFSENKPYYSRSACGLNAIPPAFAPLGDRLPTPQKDRINSDRLNILHWPDPPRRYCSFQALDTVSGLVDIVEDNWPIEGNRSVDCIYTQVKRKRKEHRSLDSILFEDDSELEYFDVLNLLPLSNVRLELTERDKSGENFDYNEERNEIAVDRRILEHRGSSSLRSCEEEVNSTKSNVTDEEKCKNQSSKSDNDSVETKDSFEESSSGKISPEKSPQDHERRKLFNVDREVDSIVDRHADSSENFAIDAAVVKNCREERETLLKVEELEVREARLRKIEETEDYKSIWISDIDEQEEMSRRPQVLRVVDSEVTKRKARQSVPVVDLELSQTPTMDKAQDSKEGTETDAVDSTVVENARSFFERKNAEKRSTRNRENEGRFERIVKETSNILGKACNAVRGSLGFEARSDSSDLGLGSETGSDGRRRSMDDGIEDDRSPGSIAKTVSDDRSETRTSHGNLTRSKSCVDSIECQDDCQEFDHVRYKIVKSNVFSRNMFSTSRKDVTYEGLMQYLREYSFQELLLDNNVVIIEPVRAEPVERKSSPSSTGKSRVSSTCKIAGAIQKKTDTENNLRNEERSEDGFVKSPKQSSIKKHFFYHPIRVNRELIDEELPDPDTVRNVREMFENTLRKKNNSEREISGDCRSGKSVSMKDLTSIDNGSFDEDKSQEAPRSRCSSRAKDLTRLFENLEKSASSVSSGTAGKEDPGSPRNETKTRILAQSFEAKSGHTSPSSSNSCKGKGNRYHQHNWDSGSVSSGVSSDYPDTDPGSAAQCTSSSDDEDVDCQDDEDVGQGDSAHFVSQDVLKKIRDCGTSVTYYGGKVVNTCNGPLISPLTGNRQKRIDGTKDYVKFKLVKSNSCDSRLELAGKFIEGRQQCQRDKDLRECTIDEASSVEATTIVERQIDRSKERRVEERIVKREPPVVIGLEPKKDDHRDNRAFKADFRLGALDESRYTCTGKITASALNRWEINETNWKPNCEFGKMEFEEFEVLEDSLNENERTEAS